MHLSKTLLVGVPLVAEYHESTSPDVSGFGVRVDSDALRSDWEECVRGQLVGWSDAQLDPSFPCRRNAGSARSTFLDGHYLKGVGRTTLWHAYGKSNADVAHASGHLFPSSAAREYLITAYCEARGIADAIVPCIGVLARDCEAQLRCAIEVEDRYERERGGAPLCAADRVLRAISVKPGNFARWSNLNYLLSTTSGRARSIAQSIEASATALGVDAWRDGVADVEGMADAVVAGADRMVDNLARFYRYGVLWGSLNNNFALDGRCVDTEVSTNFCDRIVARSSFGGDGGERLGLIVGSELVILVGEYRNALKALFHQLRRLADQAEQARLRRLLRHVIGALSARLGEAFWIWRPREVVGRIAHIYGGDLSRSEVTQLYLSTLDSDLLSPRNGMQPMACTTTASEPWHRPRWYLHLERVGCQDDTRDAIDFYNRQLAIVDASTTPGEYIASLVAARKAILQRFG